MSLAFNRASAASMAASVARFGSFGVEDSAALIDRLPGTVDLRFAID